MMKKISELRNINISEFSKVYNFGTVEFTFNINRSLNNKLDITNLNRVIDVLNREELVLNSNKYGIPSLCSVTSGKIRDKDEVVSMMKRDSEFMTIVLYYIMLISNIYNPRSLDISKIIGDSMYRSYKKYLMKKDIEIDWYYVMPDNCDLINDKDKLLITVF